MRFDLNGRDTEVAVDESTPLVYALRNDLGQRGVRAGCGIGACGACVVLVDGAPVRSCHTPLGAVDGRRVTTVEGLAGHRVPRAFLDEQAAQCGYCVNGIIMSAAALLAEESAPTEAALQSALAEHLCRCGTYHRILCAIRKLAGHDQPSPPPAVVRTEPPSSGEFEPPAVLRAAPRVEQWLRPLPDGRVEVLSGRVELGQGIRTALAQVVAAELGVPVDRIVVRTAETGTSPDEGYTAGSNSLEMGGTALAAAAAAYRRLVVAGQAPIGPVTEADRPQWTGSPLGVDVPRTDLAAKLIGGGYLHDLALPGMVHARAVLPPDERARPATPLPAEPDLLATVHDGGLILVIAEREEHAVRAAERLTRQVRWTGPSTEPGDPPDLTGVFSPETQPAKAAPPGDDRTAAVLAGQPDGGRPELVLPVVSDGDVEAALAGGRRVSARYTKPIEAHAAMAPSAAVALAEPDGGLTVWTHSQGVYPLRRELAALLGVDEPTLTVRHVDGPGCYGHNGADDAAGFAALAARAVLGRPVRFQFSVADEFGWEPYGTAMAIDLDAAIDHSGRISGWRHRVRTGAHTSRPHGSGDRLAVAWLREGGPVRPWAGGGEGGVRNAVPLYDLPHREIVGEYVRTAVRTSALRTLGAYANVFAIESFMDELAEAAGADPLAFRLAHLSDPRARTVLEAVADAAGWQPAQRPSGRGQGLAMAQYKNSKAYVAQIVEARVDTATGAITVNRVTTACDAGAVVNPDGLRNQLEGGTLQGLSRALYEELRPGVSRDWTSYPVLRFADTPALETVLIDRPGWPPLGAGEAATPVTPAALANAVDDAVGIRVRDLPLTPQRLRDRLAAMDDAELHRVRV